MFLVYHMTMIDGRKAVFCQGLSEPGGHSRATGWRLSLVEPIVRRTLKYSRSLPSKNLKIKKSAHMLMTHALKSGVLKAGNS